MTDLERKPRLAEALAKFQAEMPTVTKNKTAKVPTKSGGSYSYTYADLADVTAAAMPILARHGLSFACLPGVSMTGEHMALVGTLMHESGEAITGQLPLRGNSPQEIGSALTYMRRYLLGCMTGIVTDDDDDGAIASKPAKRAAPRREAAPPAEDFDRNVVAYRGTPEETGEAVTDAQIRKMGAAMRERGLTDRDEALAWVAQKIGREVSSRSELTKREASVVIDALERSTEAET